MGLVDVIGTQYVDVRVMAQGSVRLTHCGGTYRSVCRAVCMVNYLDTVAERCRFCHCLALALATDLVIPIYFVQRCPLGKRVVLMADANQVMRRCMTLKSR